MCSSYHVYSDRIENTDYNPQLEGLMELFYIRQIWEFTVSVSNGFKGKSFRFIQTFECFQLIFLKGK